MSLLRVGSLVTAVVLCAACSSSDEEQQKADGPVENGSYGEAEGSTERPPVVLPDDLKANLARPDEVVANVTWKPATKVIEDARLRQVLASPFSSDGVYVFDASATDVAAYTAGQVVVLHGVGIVRVLSVTTDADGIKLATETASLDEAADEVDIRFDMASPVTSNLFDADPESPSQVDIVSPATLRPGQLGVRDFQGQIDGFDATFGIRPTATGGDTYDFTLGGKLVEGDKQAAFAAFGWATRFRLVGEVKVLGGEFKGAKVGIQDAMAEMTIKGQTKRFSKKSAFDFPPLVTIPFTFAGLPLFVSVGAALEFEATGSATTAILGSAKLGMRGDATFTIGEGETSKFTGEVKSLDVKVVGANHVATVKVGLGTVVSFPKLSIGIGFPQLQDTVPAAVRKVLNAQWKSAGLAAPAKFPSAVPASAYVKLATEMVYNVDVDYEAAGPVPVVKGTCATIAMNGGIFYGGELKGFGQKLSKKVGLPEKLFDKQAGGKVGEPVKFGQTCKK